MIDETRYLLGARGIERLEAQRMEFPLQNDPLRVAKRSYPLYDGHGNPDSPRRGGAHYPSAGLKRMIATLGRTATGYTLANEKKYDVWGAVRGSQSPGSHVVNPNKQYRANLGHTFDGESDLITMRARYYELTTGRFTSEDPAMDGLNWYVYCGNDPASHIDSNGLSCEFQIGKFTVRLDGWYTEEGTGKMMRDFHWKYASDPGGLVNSVRADGVVNHGAEAPEKLVKLLDGNQRFTSWRNTTLRGGAGVGIGLTTLDAAFMADPGFVFQQFADIGMGFALFANQH